MSNTGELDSILAQLRALGDVKALEAKVAARGAVNLREALTKTLSAGQDPEGKAWVVRKIDGGRPYANAASKLSVTAYGNLIRAAVDGGEAWGHYGAGVPVRQMVPDAGAEIPKSVSDALTKAAREILAETEKSK